MWIFLTRFRQIFFFQHIRHHYRKQTSSDISVAIDRPISWNLLWFPMGPSNTNTNLVGTGTSVKSLRMIGCNSRTKATTGWFKKSTSPTRMLAASAPGGIFFIKCRLYNNCENSESKYVIWHNLLYSL